MIVDQDSLYPGTNMLKQLCGECGEVIESVEDGWDDVHNDQFICGECKDAVVNSFVPMKDVVPFL